MEVRLEQVSPEGLDTVLPTDAELAEFEKQTRENMRRVAYWWQQEAVLNAPRSPSETQLKKLHKGGSYTTKATRRIAPQTISLTAFYRRSAAALSASKRGTVSGPAGGLKARLLGIGEWKNPGGLERSIQFEHDAEHAAVFVASNAEAGEYAGIIHDKKGVKWHNRGPGTQAKGERADDKFIERAHKPAAEKLAEAMAKVVKALFRL